jgi:hypothetical protein
VEFHRPGEVTRGAIASLVTSMGRMAAHTGQVITYAEMLECPHEFAPDADKFTDQSPAPVLADANGAYPQPWPGVKNDREYLFLQSKIWQLGAEGIQARGACHLRVAAEPEPGKSRVHCSRSNPSSDSDWFTGASRGLRWATWRLPNRLHEQ